MLWRQDEIAGFLVEGHAGYGPRGRDIVCAGVSAITQTAALALQYWLGEKVTVVRKSGFLKVVVSPELGDGEKLRAETIIQAVSLGVGDIAREYPKQLRVERGYLE